MYLHTKQETRMSLARKSLPSRSLLVLSATVLQLSVVGLAHAGDDLMQRQRDLLAGRTTSQATPDLRHAVNAERSGADAQQSARQIIGAVTNAADRLPVQTVSGSHPVLGDAQALARNVLL